MHLLSFHTWFDHLDVLTPLRPKCCGISVRMSFQVVHAEAARKAKIITVSLRTIHTQEMRVDQDRCQSGNCGTAQRRQELAAECPSCKGCCDSVIHPGNHPRHCGGGCRPGRPKGAPGLGSIHHPFGECCTTSPCLQEHDLQCRSCAAYLDFSQVTLLHKPPLHKSSATSLLAKSAQQQAM